MSIAPKPTPQEEALMLQGMDLHIKLGEVRRERERQDNKWGEQNHHPLEWIGILVEEVGEVSKAANEAHFSGYETSHSKEGWAQYRKELIEVAAVAIAAVQCLDRRGYPKQG